MWRRRGIIFCVRGNPERQVLAAALRGSRTVVAAESVRFSITLTSGRDRLASVRRFRQSAAPLV